MFTSSSLKNFSIYGFINFLVPAWNPVLAFLANRFPDATLRKSRAAFDGLKDTSFEIIRSQLKGTPTSAAANGKGTAQPSDPGSRAAPEKQQHIPDAGLEGADEANYVGGFVPYLARKLSELEIVAQTNTFISAGYETTANTLSLAVYNISRSPEVERTLLAEIDAFGRDKELTYEELQKFPYTEAVLKETLRLHGPVPFMNRATRDDIQVNGYTIPKGSNVVISFWSLHHDPQHWPQPWEFQPERFMPGGQAETVHPGAYVPFGGGARACIGIKFAMMEAKLALIRLYQHYVFRLEGGADAYPPVKFFQSLTLSPIGGVRVNVLKRS